VIVLRLKSIVLTDSDSTVDQLVTDVLGLFLVGVALGTQEIGEKDHLDDDKEDEQLDADDEPQRLAHGHAAESIIIQMEHA
jgi:hypothetical protein